jgi:farnesol dehydrogenase
MKVLVTGATGFVGSAVARALADAGHELRFLVRASSDTSGLPQGEPVTGDVLDRDSFVSAARGCQAVVHSAALVKTWVPDAAAFDAVNLGGLRHALAAAREASARLVYTSSFIAVGPTGPAPADESRVHPGDRYRNDYERTKALADAEARRAAAGGADVVMLYPGVVYGPGALTDGNLVVKTILDHFAGRLPGIVGPGDRLWSYAFVEDVALGHAAALERGRRGERYFLSGENVSMNDFFRQLEEVSGRPAPRRHVPYAAAASLGLLLYLWAELTGHPPQFTHREIDVFRQHWAYSPAKAEAELGYRPTPLREGLRRTVEWLRERGLA